MLSRIQFSLIGDLGMKIPEYADHVTLVFAANMADRDPAEHMVFISRGEGEGRIKRKIRKSQINTERSRLRLPYFSYFPPKTLSVPGLFRSLKKFNYNFFGFVTFQFCFFFVFL